MFPGYFPFSAPAKLPTKHMEEEVANDAQSGIEAQELQDGSDGPAAPELQETREDAANLKQASTWNEDVGLLPEKGLIESWEYDIIKWHMNW